MCCNQAIGSQEQLSHCSLASVSPSPALPLPPLPQTLPCPFLFLHPSSTLQITAGWTWPLSLTTSSSVLSRTSSSTSIFVSSLKRKSSSTQRTYLVVTCEMARFLPANQPCRCHKVGSAVVTLVREVGGASRIPSGQPASHHGHIRNRWDSIVHSRLTTSGSKESASEKHVRDSDLLTRG